MREEITCFTKVAANTLLEVEIKYCRDANNSQSSLNIAWYSILKSLQNFQKFEKKKNLTL